MAKSQPTESTRPGRAGGYRPEQPLSTGPLYRWPPQPIALFQWFFGFPGYLWPYLIGFAAIALLSWRFLTPDMEALRNFSADWIALILLRNLTLVTLVAGAFHMQLYVRRAQGTDYKYNGKWLSVDNPTFLFRDQLWDNIFWTLCSAVPIWTTFEVLTLWMQANGHIPTVSWQMHPIYCSLLILLSVIWHSIYFYAGHRLIHWSPLYRAVHYLHHKNVNVGPWSGLAMHPMEHVLYFSEVMLYWIVPAHPVHVLLQLQLLVFGAVLSHTGFDRLMLGKKLSISSDYMHYLHHKYVRVNYGILLVPFDKWRRTFHDGSKEAQDALRKRSARAGGARKDSE